MRKKSKGIAIKAPELKALKQINNDAAGIDIGSEEMFVCVPEDRDSEPIRKFTSFTSDLYDIAAWLKQCKVKTVAMESTGIYWIPLYEILEEQGFDVCLVNPSHIKNVPGRKTDVLDAISTHKFISEVGIDMSKWPTEKHFCSWLTLAPRNDISGGKVLKSRTLKSANRAASVLRQSAQSLHHSDSALGAYYRRMRTRLGAPKATTAAAHKLARIIYNMLKYHREFVDIGAEKYEEKFKEQKLKYLRKTANELGFSLVPTTT